jgi:hypothetical protein
VLGCSIDCTGSGLTLVVVTQRSPRRAHVVRLQDGMIISDTPNLRN